MESTSLKPGSFVVFYDKGEMRYALVKETEPIACEHTRVNEPRCGECVWVEDAYGEIVSIHRSALLELTDKEAVPDGGSEEAMYKWAAAFCCCVGIGTLVSGCYWFAYGHYVWALGGFWVSFLSFFMACSFGRAARW